MATPQHMKELAGTARKDRTPEHIEMGTLSDMPPVPLWMREHKVACEQWEKLTPILLANGMLADGNLDSLAIVCMIHSQLVTSLAAGELPTAAVLSQYRALMNDFGLTPMAAQRVGRSRTKNARNKFDNNG